MKNKEQAVLVYAVVAVVVWQRTEKMEELIAISSVYLYICQWDVVYINKHILIDILDHLSFIFWEYSICVCVYAKHSNDLFWDKSPSWNQGIC